MNTDVTGTMQIQYLRSAIKRAQEVPGAQWLDDLAPFVELLKFLDTNKETLDQLRVWQGRWAEARGRVLYSHRAYELFVSEKMYMQAAAYKVLHRLNNFAVPGQYADDDTIDPDVISYFEDQGFKITVVKVLTAVKSKSSIRLNIRGPNTVFSLGARELFAKSR